MHDINGVINVPESSFFPSLCPRRRTVVEASLQPPLQISQISQGTSGDCSDIIRLFCLPRDCSDIVRLLWMCGDWGGIVRIIWMYRDRGDIVRLLGIRVI